MNDFWERKDGYGIQVNEYNGNYSLQAAKQKEDKIYLDWAFLSKWDEGTRGFVPDEKKRPMSVYLGDRESAIKALKFFLNELTRNDGGGQAPDPGDPVQGEPENSIPF